MKKIVLLTIILPVITAAISAQTQSISSILNHFSPLAEIIVRNLGMEDKNNNGIIDKNAGEGYEEFIERCGIGETFTEKERSIDRGFHANGIIIGANNGRLEEPEIVNHYYINIRFKPVFAEEERAIEQEITAYIRANNLPLVWLDDEQGTVMNEVTRVLGEGWNNPAVVRSENEAVRMFNSAVSGMRIAGRTGIPSRNGGYYSLPEMVNRRAGYCFEVAQFGFWFFSQLRINSVSAIAALNSNTLHEVVRLNSGRRVDYSGSGNRYRVPAENWELSNPLQNMGTYYSVWGEAMVRLTAVQESVLFDKYNLGNIGQLLNFYFNNSFFQDSTNIINLGEFFLSNNDISRLLRVRRADSAVVKEQIKIVLIMLFVAYNETDNGPGASRIASLLKTYFTADAVVRNYLNTYGF